MGLCDVLRFKTEFGPEFTRIGENYVNIVFAVDPQRIVFVCEAFPLAKLEYNCGSIETWPTHKTTKFRTFNAVGGRIVITRKSQSSPVVNLQKTNCSFTARICWDVKSRTL